jgi:hydrogenase/urease accessory protein HupE
MKSRIFILLSLLILSRSVFAHRLNEYLVATTVNLSAEKIQFEVRLTPGADVASELLKEIDLNRDQLISAAEQQAYVNLLTHDLHVRLDGRYVVLRPVSFSFPTVSDMRKGIGDILVEFETDMGSPARPSEHRLELKDGHYSSIAVYLVNCLVPSDTSIHVTGQWRNADQSVYQLEFSTGDLRPGRTVIHRQAGANAEHKAVIKTYFVHGIWHILTGYDHLLFLCALVLGATGLWDLIKIVTAFTIAHSITLTLATFGLAHLPPYIVEPFISASIVFIAAQNVFFPNRTSSAWRLATAFFFGLFHGLGFAGGLLELMHAMPANLVAYAILGFSLGVEAGNQLVLLPLYGLIKGVHLFRVENASKKRRFTFRQFASAAVAISGLYYLCVALVTDL